jgi:hypothetical protein
VLTEKQPEFTTPMRDQHVWEKDQAVFSFILNKPNVQCKWTFKKKTVTLDERIVFVNNNLSYDLFINDAELTDAGKWTVELPNGKKITASLTVDGK